MRIISSREPLEFFAGAYLLAVRVLMLFGLIFVALMLAMALGPSRAQARPAAGWGPVSPEVSAWAKQQHNSRGEWCCDESDGHPYFGDYTVHPDGHVTAEIDGRPHEIDSSLVLKGPNPTGHAVWWYRVISGFHRDYCFSPGTLG